MQNDSKPVSLRQLGCGTLFLGFFLILGSLFVVLMLREAVLTAATYSWQKTDCEILVSEGRVDPDADSEDPPYEFVTQYRYNWKGAEQVSSTYSRRGATFDDWAKVRKLVEKHPVGSHVSCYVNPDDPSRAILKRDSFWMLLFLPLPLLFVAIGGGGIWFLWFGKEKEERLQALSDRSRARKRWVLPAVFALFALVGLGLLVGLFLPSAMTMLDSQSWAPVPCRVEFSRVGVHEGDESTTYSIDVLYSYEVGGTVHRSSRYRHFNFSSSGTAGKRDVVRSLPRGTETTCYYNPDDPREAVMDRSFSFGLLLGLLPLTFLLVGLFGLRHQLRNMSERTVAGIRAPEFSSGPLVLEPKVGKWGKLAGIVFFASFWNGIVGVFLFQVFESWQRGRVEWFLVLFLVPFVLVGLGTIVGVGYFLLALANPRPRLKLTPGTLRPGSSASLEWELLGRSSAVRRVKITFGASEQETERRGKSSRTKKHQFHEDEVFNSGESLMTPRGSASFRVPRDAMHSFDAGNAKVVWTLHVHGEVARWPDIDAEYPVDVFPLGAASFDTDGSDDDPEAVREGGLSLQLARQRHAPGSTVEGTAEWDLDAPPESVEVRLFWHLTETQAKRSEVVAHAVFDGAGERGRRPFRLELPPVPYSYRGEGFSIEWAVELVTTKPDRVVRAELTVRP